MPRPLTLAFKTLFSAFLVVLAACTPPPPKDPFVLPTRLDTSFRATMDELGVDLGLPPAGKAILVNIPSYELLALEDGVPVLRTRVIVGKRRTQTPVMDLRTDFVRFRPAWAPTPQMIAEGAFADRVWDPGADNPLGLAAVQLSPNLLIYMHDTNRRDLFEREARALSWGCVRVERWDDLIAWALDLPVDQVLDFANSEPTRDLPMAEIPVLIRYLTLFPDVWGNLQRHEDIYGLGHNATPAPYDPNAGAVAVTDGQTLSGL